MNCGAFRRGTLGRLPSSRQQSGTVINLSDKSSMGGALSSDGNFSTCYIRILLALVDISQSPHHFPQSLLMNMDNLDPQRRDVTIYRGNCHCGAYRYELTVPLIKEVISCDCTLCRKKGPYWIVPPPGAFTVTRDDGRLIKYQSSVAYDMVLPAESTPSTYSIA